MSERLRPRRGRASAFDTARTDLEDVTSVAPAPPPLGELMPKVSKAREEVSPPARQAKGESPAPTPPRSETPRGVGGRPTRQPDRPQDRGSRGVTKRPARIPADLYRRAEPLVKGPGKPSWGQLIYWACTTHREAVVDGAIEWVKPTDPLAPRGANRAGGVTTPIIPQFLGEEIAPVDAVKTAAEEALARDESRGPVKVTATAVVIAALTVAAETPPEASSAGHGA